MYMSSLNRGLIAILLGAGLTLGNPASTAFASENRNCAYANCLKPTDVAPRARPTISKFCESVLKTTPVPKTVTTTEEVIVVITPPTATKTVTTTVTATNSPAVRAAAKAIRGLSLTSHTSNAESRPLISATASRPAQNLNTKPTSVTTQPYYPELEIQIREAPPKPTTTYPQPSELVKGCKSTSPAPSKFSPVCSCFLTTPTVTSTVTTTQTGTLKATTATVTRTVTVTR